MTASGFRFSAASSKHECSPRYSNDLFSKNCKQIEALLNYRRSFIEGSTRFPRTEPSPESQQAIRVALKLLEATLFQEHSSLQVGVRLEIRIMLILSIFIDRIDLTDT